MTVWEAIILGIVQGLTEFLPVSSSGHIELGKALLGVQPSDPLLFSVVVHVATSLSTIVVFRRDIAELIMGLFVRKSGNSSRFLFFIFISMLPAAFVGIFYADDIETLFDSNVPLVGSMLFVTAALLFFTDFMPAKEGKLTLLNTLVIGLSQAIAIIPGISRSGATISTAVILGISRVEASRFSFLMVVPLILGKMSKDIIDNKVDFASGQFIPLLAGFIAAFLVGVFACQWMIKLVRNSKLRYFAIYCLVAGTLSLLAHYFWR